MSSNGVSYSKYSFSIDKMLINKNSLKNDIRYNFIVSSKGRVPNQENKMPDLKNKIPNSDRFSRAFDKLVMNDEKYLQLPKLSRHITHFNEIMKLNPKFYEDSKFDVKQPSYDLIPKSIYISRNAEENEIIDDIWKDNTEEPIIKVVQPKKKNIHIISLVKKPIKIQIDMRCYHPNYTSIDKKVPSFYFSRPNLSSVTNGYKDKPSPNISKGSLITTSHDTIMIKRNLKIKINKSKE